MDVLVIGGSRFVGRQLAHRLALRGDRVTLLHRGTRDDGLGELVGAGRVERLLADRGTDAFDAALHGRTFDAVVDFAAYVPEDLERAVRVLGGRVGHYVFVSTGQVYLVRDEHTQPTGEDQYQGEVMPRPDDPADHWDWDYGIQKRACEDLIARSARALPHAVRVRVPMIHGPNDPHRRIERLLARMLDGGPVLVPRPDASVRHVYGPWLAAFLADRLGDRRFDGAFNVAPIEAVSVRGLVARVASAAGSTAPLVPVGADDLLGAGLRAEQVSPFGGRWMSMLDPARAVHELGLAHPPMEAWLPALVHGLIASRPSEPPPDLAHRAKEIALGRALLDAA